MMNCKDCMKSDVCRKQTIIQKNIEKLNVNPDYQSLLRQDIKIAMSCVHYAQATKILGGNYEQ